MGAGLGPVFWFEWVRAARRWQMFAVRTGVLLVLFFLILIVPDWSHIDRTVAPHRYWPKINQTIFAVSTWTILAGNLLAAPACMAGA